MTSLPQRAPGFWRTVRVLLGTARRRAKGRRGRQRELLGQRTGRQSAIDWGPFGTVVTFLFMAAIQVGAGYVLLMAVDTGQRLSVELTGTIPVDDWFYQAVHDRAAEPLYHREAVSLSRRYGGASATIEQRLRVAVQAHGDADLIPWRRGVQGIKSLAHTGSFPMMFGSCLLLWWGIMLVFQGEGLELDIQRRRHPLWEWIFSHPVPASAVFFAEILSPLAANPVYWASPLFAGVVYGAVYGPGLGALAVLLAGIPVTISAACLGKALEIGVMLRFSPRTRGAVLGFMSWIGYSTFMLFFAVAVLLPKMSAMAGKALAPLAFLPWPFLRLFVGGPWPALVAHLQLATRLPEPEGFSFVAGVLTCWAASLMVMALGVWFTIWGGQRGLAGSGGDIAPARARSFAPARFRSHPIYRKELLWFVRDRSAIVQCILVPLTVAALQMFNLRGVLGHAGESWNRLCGAAILFGTYFLWVLGPKSLASEGQALWISLSWPSGLENLLRAKAWLWSVVASAIVFIVLLAVAFLFPAESFKIALVGVGWAVFARSMAEKSVTLVTVASSSGESPPIPRGRRAATQLGMLTFALGIATGQWHLAIVGIVFSWVTAAAMWQNFRARLPFLYDPWSEKLPPPPTLMHAMVAISLLIESGSVLIACALTFAPRHDLAATTALAYAVSATVAFFGTARFLSGRGVLQNQVWTWTEGRPPTPRLDKSLEDYIAEPRFSFAEQYGLTGRRLGSALLLGLALGVALGFLAHGYTAVLHHIPSLRAMFRDTEQKFSGIPGLHLAYVVMAVGLAPFAEEYLFRGLLYRALDRDWGGWRAILGAAAFFTVYHPLLAWPLVFTVGAVNCILFKQTRRLLPCIVLHMAYNAVVLLH